MGAIEKTAPGKGFVPARGLGVWTRAALMREAWRPIHPSATGVPVELWPGAASCPLFEHLCERNAVETNPVKGVKRPKVES